MFELGLLLCCFSLVRSSLFKIGWEFQTGILLDPEQFSVLGLELPHRKQVLYETDLLSFQVDDAADDQYCLEVVIPNVDQFGLDVSSVSRKELANSLTKLEAFFEYQIVYGRKKIPYIFFEDSRERFLIMGEHSKSRDSRGLNQLTIGVPIVLWWTLLQETLQLENMHMFYNVLSRGVVGEIFKRIDQIPLSDTGKFLLFLCSVWITIGNSHSIHEIPKNAVLLLLRTHLGDVYRYVPEADKRFFESHGTSFIDRFVKRDTKQLEARGFAKVASQIAEVTGTIFMSTLMFGKGFLSKDGNHIVRGPTIIEFMQTMVQGGDIYSQLDYDHSIGQQHPLDATAAVEFRIHNYMDVQQFTKYVDDTFTWFEQFRDRYQGAIV